MLSVEHNCGHSGNCGIGKGDARELADASDSVGFGILPFAGEF